MRNLETLTTFSGDLERRQSVEYQNNAKLHAQDCFGLEALGYAYTRLPGGGDNGQFKISDLHHAIVRAPEAFRHTEELETSKRVLIEALDDSLLCMSALKMVRRGVQHVNVRDYVSTYITGESLQDPQLLQQRLDKMPLDVYALLLAFHAGDFCNQAESFQERQSKIKQQFLLRLNRGVAAGKLNFDIAWCKNHLSKVGIRLRDALVGEMMHEHGLWSPEKGVVYISSGVEGDDADALVSHELTHAVSASTAAMEESARFHIVLPAYAGVWQGKTTETGLQYIRSGLMHYDPRVGRQRLWWLNEAETERTSQIVRNKNTGLATEVYQHELMLRDTLLRMGKKQLPESVYQPAYTTHDRGETIQALKEEFNQAYHSGFLYDVDDAVQIYGSERTRQFLQSEGPRWLSDFMETTRFHRTFGRRSA